MINLGFIAGIGLADVWGWRLFGSAAPAEWADFFAAPAIFGLAGFFMFLAAAVGVGRKIKFVGRGQTDHCRKFLRRRNFRSILSLFFLFFACLLLGFWRYQISLPDFSDPAEIYHYNGQKVLLSGKVAVTEERINGQKLTVAVETAVVSAAAAVKSAPAESAAAPARKVSGKVLISAPLYPKYHYADRLQITCALEAPEKIEDFDYPKYLARYDIYSLCLSARISAAAENSLPTEQKNYVAAVGGVGITDRFFIALFAIRDRLAAGLYRTVSEPEVSVLVAMLFNLSRGIPAEITEQFAALGITHIIAISGSHITLVATILMALAVSFGLRRQVAFWPVSFAIIAYTLMVGAPASAARSAVMGVMILYAKKIGRQSSMTVALVFTAALMLAQNPRLLLSDVGFQLSFAAVAGLVYVLPRLQKLFSKLPEWGPIKEIFLMTLAAQITTLPLTIFYFGRFSLMSFVANILILPVIPFLMIFGLITAGASVIFLPLGRLLGWASWLVLFYWLKVVEMLS